MASGRQKLHIQSLEYVMLQLERCRDPRAAHAYRLAEKGDLYPLGEGVLAELRCQLQDTLADDISRYPILRGAKDLPLRLRPTPAQLQNVLQRDIGGPNTYRFAPSLGSLRPRLLAYRLPASWCTGRCCLPTTSS